MTTTILNFSQMIQESRTVFLDKYCLENGYFPTELKNLPHRTKEINFLMTRLVDALKGYVPNNIILYGKTGTGKSTVVKSVINQLLIESKEQKSKIDVSYLNCENAKTGTAILKQINQQMQNRLSVSNTNNKTENSFQAYYREFRRLATEYNGIIIIILDEIDKLKDRDFISLISRIKETGELDKNICMLGITNDLFFRDSLDARTKSSLGERSFLFTPYNADQLRDILQTRAAIALLPGVLEDETIPLCAAYAAQEHGDARKAIELLKVAAEVTEITKSKTITEQHVKTAKLIIEETMVLDAITTLPLQSKILLASCVILYKPLKTISSTDIYEVYTELSKEMGTETLTDRRARDILSELDLMGLLHINIVYKGRYGRGREIILKVPTNKIKEYLLNEERFTTIKWGHKNQQKYF